jgi:diaminohydroxyphosphoribosylaminopyrimidine deaminase / 5-amino-6-(5-phosphoribosylamino)uracil reductase
MRRAIALSAFGVGGSSPNPAVGCVVLDAEGRVAGEGYHRRKGEAHAEANALRAAGGRARGGTAVVTLEPCNHQGRTPPCHQALLDAGVARTVVAVLDPTSRGVGGVARLREAGMDVEVGVLAEEATLVLGPWLASLRRGRPYVVWTYGLAAGGDYRPGPADDDVMAGVDAVLGEDGRVVEAVPGRHGPGEIDIAHARRGQPLEILAALHRGGVRALLLDGGPGLAAPFLDRRLVDRVLVRVHEQEPALPGAGPPELLPAGFQLRDVRRCKGHVQVVGVAHTEAEDPGYPIREEGR